MQDVALVQSSGTQGTLVAHGGASAHAGRSRSGIARALALSGMLVLSFAFATTAPATAAQVDRVSCGFFETQEDAQAALDARPELATTLDGDGNGVACEDLQTGGPVVVDRVSCGFFETREDAQTALDDDPDLATTLDSDGNGIACEDRPSDEDDSATPTPAAGGTVKLPNTGTSPLQQAGSLLGLVVTALLVTVIGSLSLRTHRHA